MDSVKDSTRFYQTAIAFLETQTDAQLGWHAARYVQHLEALSVGDGEAQQVDLPVELLWRTHLLHPEAYQQACEALQQGSSSGSSEGKGEGEGEGDSLIDHKPVPLGGMPVPAVVPDEGADHEAACRSSHTAQSEAWLGLNLVAAVRRQQQFMKDVLLLCSADLRSDERVRGAVADYAHFLSRMRHSPHLPVPSMLVDVVWHAHQLDPRRYARDCVRIAGHRVNHDDQPHCEHEHVEAHSGSENIDTTPAVAGHA